MKKKKRVYINKSNLIQQRKEKDKNRKIKKTAK